MRKSYILKQHTFDKDFSFSAHKSDVIALCFFLANSRCTLRMTTALWLHNLSLLLSFACISPGVSSCVLKCRFRYFPLICVGMKLLCLYSSFIWIYRGVIFVFRCLCSDSGFLVKRPSESQGLGGMLPWADRTLGDKRAVVLHSCFFCWESSAEGFISFPAAFSPRKEEMSAAAFMKVVLESAERMHLCPCGNVVTLQAHIL